MRKVQRDFPYIVAPKLHGLPFMNIPLQGVTTDESILTHHNYPKFIVYTMGSLYIQCCVLYELGEMHSDNHTLLEYYADYFHCTKLFCAQSTHPFPTSLVDTDHLFLSPQFSLSRMPYSLNHTVYRLSRCVAFT